MSETYNQPMSEIYEEYEEMEDGVGIVECKEWWKADLAYLPIHHFKKEMEECLYEMSIYPTWKRLQEIMEEVEERLTKEVITEFHLEYEFVYGEGIITDWMSQPIVQTGYIDILQRYIAKLLVLYSTPRKEYILPTLKNYILQFHSKFFSRPRHWNDTNLDSIHLLLLQL